MTDIIYNRVNEHTGVNENAPRVIVVVTPKDLEQDVVDSEPHAD